MRIKPTQDALANIGGQKLVPGMPVEAYIQTGQRTALSYLTKLFTDQFAPRFKER